ncbi:MULTISPECIES: substrate-binding domain-containing protein [unclassified Vibrio]|uniref:Ribose operon repressor n=1 Tax=Vibrio sp. HB236076 TaxID=3232307 RepID=A0AB39HLV9_9VIBR|nr:substrate-binding domain-containing protein [Vibrio sp. HB161653]MDP5253142.1 substrate-binding domain-containing protein [Vibrio sp. HB161653]
MATMKDIAKLAGVSTSTVSHVINQSRYVSEDITAKVQHAAKTLNYHAPSILGRSLKKNRTQTFGMLLTTSVNPFFGEVVKGVERHCYQQGYHLVLCNTEGDSERMQASIETLLQRRVDGLIIMCSIIEAQQLDILQQYPDIPVVLMDRGPMRFRCDKIQDNSHRGGMMATEYLLSQGHQHIGCITGPMHLRQASLRYAGFEQAMQQAGQEINRDWVVESDFDCQGGIDAFERLWAQSNKPTALFVSNDMMALGVIQAAQKHGLSLPADLSIIGYDNIHMAQFFTPALTTIHQPKYRMGKAAVEALIERLRVPDLEEQLVELLPELVVRDSVTKKQ